MYYYAAYRDFSNPEVVIKDFYNAYFQRDYEKVADNLSVFWGVQFMPQYMFMNPNELIANRPEIEKNMAEFISRVEADNDIPEGLSINVLPQYTKRENNTALVAYEFIENNKPIGTEMALLLKENNRMHILKMIPVEKEQLQQLRDEDLAATEESYKEMLGR